MTDTAKGSGPGTKSLEEPATQNRVSINSRVEVSAPEVETPEADAPKASPEMEAMRAAQEARMEKRRVSLHLGERVKEVIQSVPMNKGMCWAEYSKHAYERFGRNKSFGCECASDRDGRDGRERRDLQSCVSAGRDVIGASGLCRICGKYMLKKKPVKQREAPNLCWTEDLYELCRPLLEQGKPDPAFGLHHSEQQYCLRAVSQRLEKTPWDWKGPENPLKMAVDAKCADLVFVMLHAGMDPNDSDHRGVTGLHDAVFMGRIDICRILLDGGADVNAPDRHNQSPLFFVDGVDICTLLVERQADIDMLNTKGQTALHLAARAGFRDVVDFLTNRAGQDIVHLKDTFGAKAASYLKISDPEPAVEVAPSISRSVQQKRSQSARSWRPRDKRGTELPPKGQWFPAVDTKLQEGAAEGRKSASRPASQSAPTSRGVATAAESRKSGSQAIPQSLPKSEGEVAANKVEAQEAAAETEAAAGWFSWGAGDDAAAKAEAENEAAAKAKAENDAIATAAAEKEAADKVEAEKAEAAKKVAEKAEAELAEKAAAEKVAADKAAAEKAATDEKAAAEKDAAEKRAGEDKAAAEKAAIEQAAAEKAAVEQAAAEKAAVEQAAAEKAASELAEKRKSVEGKDEAKGTARRSTDENRKSGSLGSLDALGSIGAIGDDYMVDNIDPLPASKAAVDVKSDDEAAGEEEEEESEEETQKEGDDLVDDDFGGEAF